MKVPAKAPVAVCLAVVVILGIYNIYILFHPSVQTQIALPGTIEQVVTADGYIIRDEIIEAENSGMVVDSMVQEGERVAKDTLVAMLYGATVDPQTQASLKAIQNKLNSLQRLKNQNDSISANDAGGIESITRDKVIEAMEYAHLGDGSSLSGIKMQLDELVNKKIAVNASQTDLIIESLQQEKQNLEAGIAGEKQSVYASESGLYFSNFDGYEGLLTVDSIESLTPSALQQLEGLQQTGEQKSGAKIVKGFTWNIALAVDTKDITMLKKGSSVQIRLPEFGSEVYDATVVFLSGDENGKTVVVCNSDAYTDTVFYNRKVKTELVLDASSGLKFSKDAVQVVDGVTGVYIVKDSTVRFRPVDILASDKGSVVIKENNDWGADTVLLYDEVIIKGNGVKEGDLIRQ